MMTAHASAITLLLTLTLGGCASLTVADTKPLPANKLEPPGSERISKGGYRLDAIAESPATPDLLVIVAMSGGGKRSAAFSYGALKGLRDLPLQTPVGPRPLLAACRTEFTSWVVGAERRPRWRRLTRLAEAPLLHDD